MLIKISIFNCMKNRSSGSQVFWHADNHCIFSRYNPQPLVLTQTVERNAPFSYLTGLVMLIHGQQVAQSISQRALPENHEISKCTGVLLSEVVCIVKRSHASALYRKHYLWKCTNLGFCFMQIIRTCYFGPSMTKIIATFNAETWD
jgi:hypothetical protein